MAATVKGASDRSSRLVKGPVKASKNPFEGKEGKGIPGVWSLPEIRKREVSLNAKPSPKPLKSFSRKSLGEPIGNYDQ
jgi:hypothetical protein